MRQAAASFFFGSWHAILDKDGFSDYVDSADFFARFLDNDEKAVE